MNKYIFILGTWPEISKKEISSLLNDSSDSLILTGPNFVIYQTTKQAPELIKALGGTVKIAKFIGEIDSLEELDSQKWQSYLEISNEDKKINFGFSLYNDSWKNYKELELTAFQLKKDLKNQGYKARYVSSRQKELSSVIVKKNNLLGNELIIIKTENNFLLGLTQSVQDFANYSLRDFKRPERDDKSGMLPPKLAQMMINLAGADRKKIILDPFCGSGTVLQEALMLGFKKIHGTDLSQKAISDSQKNITWLKEKLKISAEVKLQKIDATKLSDYFKKQSIDLIVTEPFMGDARFIHGQINIKNLNSLKLELQNLYISAFKQFQKILKKDGQVVFVFPIFNIHGSRLETLDKQNIIKLGFKLISAELIYSRENQKVERQLSLWQKIN
jgi:tRNA G10  N-methylase Trm11